VSAELGAGLDTATGDADLDPAPVQVGTTAREVIALVRVQLLGPALRTTTAARASTDTGVGVEQGFEQLAVVGVRRRDQDVQR
jgi:hypothetical protein